MRIVLCSLAIVCGMILFVDMETREPPVLQERDVLVDLLSTDVFDLISKESLSKEDQRVAFTLLVSFSQNPPLKTAEEIKEYDKEAEASLRDIKQALKKTIEEGLLEGNVENHPLPVITSDLAYDLARITRLKDLFKSSNMESQVLEELLQRVLAEIWVTKSA